MTIIAFAPKYNTAGRHDATGAFIPEATRFLEYHGQSKEGLTLVDNTAPSAKMRSVVLSAIDRAPDRLSCVAFFCHGTKRGIQLGFDLKTVRDLASTIYAAARADVIPFTMPLYSCDTGRDTDSDRLDDMDMIGGDGGFADTLRDELCRLGILPCRVDAHTTTGHTTRNPFVRRFPGIVPEGGVGGYYIVPPRSKLWSKWGKALLTGFRFDYPLTSDAGIYNYLTAR